MAEWSWPDILRLWEEEQGNVEQFNEAVRWAGRAAWWAVARQTKKDGWATAQWFAGTGQQIVKDLQTSWAGE